MTRAQESAAMTEAEFDVIREDYVLALESLAEAVGDFFANSGNEEIGAMYYWRTIANQRRFRLPVEICGKCGEEFNGVGLLCPACEREETARKADHRGDREAGTPDSIPF